MKERKKYGLRGRGAARSSRSDKRFFRERIEKRFFGACATGFASDCGGLMLRDCDRSGVHFFGVLMNLIVQNSPAIRWYTDLVPFLARLGLRVEQYVWLVTSVELNVGVLPFLEEPSDSYWVAGRDLVCFVESVRPQFIWAVLSAIAVKNEHAARLQACYPTADGDRGFWKGVLRPQHPYAEFEVVCLDSTSTLLIGANEEIAECFRVAYPGAMDLDMENAKRHK